MIFTSDMKDACNQVAHGKADLRFAKRIRAFRPEPVAAVSDLQLAQIVRRSRMAARQLGIRDNALVTRFVMIDALIAPKFYENPETVGHFERASGSPDVKIGDVFQVLKLTLRQYGRGDEVWW